MTKLTKIHEIIDNIDIENEDLKIAKSKVSKEEKNRILEMALNKANIRKEKIFNRKYILSLAAAMTLILSFAVVFAQGGLSNIYYKLFGENIKYVTEMGTIIDESYSSNGITFNVSNMLGDENSFYIIFEIIKENGESFKDSDYIEFDRFSLDFKSSGGYTWYQIEDDDKNDNIPTFILSGNTKNKISGNKLTISATDITEYSIKEPAVKFDPYNFLIDNQDFIEQNLEKNLQKSTPDIKNHDNYSKEEIDKIEEIYRLTPNYVLPWKYLNIPADEGLNEIYIDNIGFAENKLCIRIALSDKEMHSLGEIYFANKNSPEDILYNEFMLSEEKNGIKYYYYIFNIENMEELKNYNFIYDIVSKLSTTRGEWNVTFKADYKNTTKTIKVNKETKINDKRYTVKNIKISPIALNVELKNNFSDNYENPVHNFSEAISVIMKDGTKIEPTSSGSGTNPLTSYIYLMFEQPINTGQIHKIVIGDIEIEFE